MAAEFCCGFECGAVGHWTATGVPTIVVASQYGVRAAQFVRTDTNPVFYKSAALGSNGITVMRAYVYFSVLTDASCGFLGVEIAGTHSGIRFIRSTATFNTACNGNIAAAGPVCEAGRWYSVDIVINTSANPWTVDAKIDGVACPQATSATVANVTARPVIVGLISGPGISTGTMISNGLIAGTTLADYPFPAGVVYGYVPVSDGTHNIAGTGDFQRGNTAVDILNSTLSAAQLISKVPMPSGTVDEVNNWRAVAPLNATDYPEAIFGPIIGTPLGTPLTVEVLCAYHQIATGAGSMDVLLNDNGTTGNVLVISAAAGVVTYRYARAHFATAPTGGAWTSSAGAGNFNNLRVRFRSADANPDQILDAIIAEGYFLLPTGLSINKRVPGKPAPFKPGEVVRVKH